MSNALKSRAEVQLWSALNQNKPRSASAYLHEQQQQQIEEEGDPENSFPGDNGQVGQENQRQRRHHAAQRIKPPSEHEVMISEVRQLDDLCFTGQENNSKLNLYEDDDPAESHTQIELNAIRRRDEHMAALAQYASIVKEISEEIEVRLIQTADKVKDDLAELDKRLVVSERALEDEALLLSSTNENILDMRVQTEAICAERTQLIALFAGQLDDIEQTRTQRVRSGLQTLTQMLMDTAFALAPEVERIIEAESYELNIVVISNRKVYADLVARMATADVDIFVSAQLAWEAGQRRWRALRHNHAIAAFQSTLNSNTFKDPDERHAVLAQIRDYQSMVHEQRRLAALQELERVGANLTSEHAQQIVAALSQTQQDEEEQNHRFFTSLLALHDAKTLEAQALREALRLELHGFGAMAPEGEIVLARNTLAQMLADDSLEDFFRMAGGLRTELDQIFKRMELKELIYADNLVPLRDSLQVLLSALPLETVMEAQGKGAERKAVQATLEKIRKAGKQEIMALLPTLQAEVGVLRNINDMNSVFSAEIEAIGMQLDTILQDHYVLVNGTSSPEGSVQTNIESGSGEIPRPNTSVVSATGTTIGSPMAATMRVQTESPGPATSTTTVDLQAVRKVQRRLGMLMYASELTPALQTHLQFIAEQLTLQHGANSVVDAVVSTSCDELLEVRQLESRLFLDDLGQRIEHQSSTLHDHCEKLASFCLRVALCMEQNVNKVRIVNMSVMDLLDTLRDNDDEAHGAMEDSFSKSCARLRHAPDNATLRQEFQTAKDLLASMEAEYRLYQRRTQVAASHHVLAIDAQRVFFLGPLCESFGLKPPVNETQACHEPGAGEDPLNLERFLSPQCIEDITNPKPKDVEQGDNGGNPLANDDISSHSTGQATAVTSPRTEASQPHAAANGSGPSHGHEKATKAAANHGRKPVTAPVPAAPVEPPPELFHASSGLELQLVHPIPELVQHILTQKDEPYDQLEGDSNESPLSPDELTETKHTEESPELASPPVLSESEQLTAEALAARKAHVVDMVSRSFLELRIPDEVMDQLLVCYRDGMLSRFDVHARETSALTLTAHDARIEEGHRLLEERLRMHWPRKGRLEVQCYQPRVSELTSHTQRLDRHVRSLLKKVVTQQTAFDSRVSDALASIERSRVTFVGCNAQLPMQLSLAALQGLDVKFNKLLTAFRSESETQRQQLQLQTESELNAVAASAQEFVNACSAQLFPDLTGTDVMAGCDYHPLEIDALRKQLASTETGIREQLALRAQSMADLAEKQLQVLQLSSAFKARYQSCLQNLSMKDGLGQKYGLPRRSAQERYRSETTRCDERSSKIDELLATLKSLSAGDKLTEPKDEEEKPTSRSTRIVTLLLQLRAKMFARGCYFGLLKNKSQLEVTAIEYVVRPADGDVAEVVLRDRDLLAHDDLPPSISFLDFVQRVGVQCREETRALYQQEGKLDELPPNGGVPPALEEYLLAQKEKAMAYVLQQETKFRKQVEQLGDLLATVPEAALRDLCQRSQQMLKQSTLPLSETMERFFESSMDLKQTHMAELRPALFSPNNTAQLQELCSREEERSVQMQSELRSYKTQVLSSHKACSHTLEYDLLALTRCLMAVLDSTVMSLDDLQPVDGSDQLARAKRKSLTRLRKMARVLEFGDSREVPRSVKELETLAQLGESARFPRRAWPGIASFGMDQQLWPAVHALQDEKDGAKPDAAQPGSSQGDGACVALLTHAHRALVHARDTVYTQYVAFCRDHNAQLLALAQERLQDERKWTQSWTISIARMQQNDV